MCSCVNVQNILSVVTFLISESMFGWPCTDANYFKQTVLRDNASSEAKWTSTTVQSP